MTEVPASGANPPVPFAYHFFGSIGRGVVRAIARMQWDGFEKIPDEGPFVAAVNHVSNTDFLTTASYLMHAGRFPKILAKESLFRATGAKGILKSTGMIPVYRGTTKAVDALKAAEDALDRGECIAIYPEGTTTKDPDMWPMVGHTGAVRLAMRAGVPIIPIAQWGPQHFPPDGGKFPKFFPRTLVRMRAGDPVDISDLAGRPDELEALHMGTERVMAAITELLAPLREEPVPTGPRFDPRHDRR